MKAKITDIEYPVRYDAAMSCEAFRQHARVTYQSPAERLPPSKRRIHRGCAGIEYPRQAKIEDLK